MALSVITLSIWNPGRRTPLGTLIFNVCKSKITAPSPKEPTTNEWAPTWTNEIIGSEKPKLSILELLLT